MTLDRILHTIRLDLYTGWSHKRLQGAQQKSDRESVFFDGEKEAKKPEKEVGGQRLKYSSESLVRSSSKKLTMRSPGQQRVVEAIQHIHASSGIELDT